MWELKIDQKSVVSIIPLTPLMTIPDMKQHTHANRVISR